MKILIFGSVVCLITSFLDGIRDSGVGRWAGWWDWHIVKWVSFYLPMGSVVMLCGIIAGIPWGWFLMWVIVLAVVCRVVWKAGYAGNFFRERNGK